MHVFAVTFPAIVISVPPATYSNIGHILSEALN
jgi:hypothetical protein